MNGTIITPVAHLFDKLHKAYTEPHRIYHNMNHIVCMFQIAQNNNIELGIDHILAVWFHDFVYTPGAPTNEEDSADALKDLYKDNADIPQHIIYSACDMIRDTKKELPERSNKSKVLIDLDLWGLGYANAYWVNKNKIQDEFLPYCENLATFREGRLKWLHSMLERESIFVSDFATLKMERTARRNIQKEIKTLSLQLGLQ